MPQCVSRVTSQLTKCYQVFVQKLAPNINKSIAIKFPIVPYEKNFQMSPYSFKNHPLQCLQAPLLFWLCIIRDYWGKELYGIPPHTVDWIRDVIVLRVLWWRQQGYNAVAIHLWIRLLMMKTHFRGCKLVNMKLFLHPPSKYFETQI